jgi:hypothetical protein
MDDLISRKAAIESIKDPVVKGFALYALKNVPSVPAVPLDKLCEWLEENAEFPMEVEVKMFYEPTEEPEIKLNRMLSDAERWREKLTKWMEEQDEAD